MNKRKLICIRCPRGCEIETTLDGYTVTEITGNYCKLGNEYAENEIKDPKRVVTSTVKVMNGEFPLVPVWTSGPVPKEKIFDLMNILKNIELEAPVKIDSIVVENALELGIEITASGKVDRV
jgi:CxxC motif-containing protein